MQKTVFLLCYCTPARATHKLKMAGEYVHSVVFVLMNHDGSVDNLLKAISLLSVSAICAVLVLFSLWTPIVKFS